MDHAVMIFITGMAIGGYAYKLRDHKHLDTGIIIICLGACAWLSVYVLVELGRSTLGQIFTGKAGDANPLTAILLGGSVAINMPKRKKPEDEPVREEGKVV